MSFLYSYILSNLSEILKYSINFLILINKSSAVADMGDRGHNRRGPKEGAVVPSALLRGRAKCPPNTMWPGSSSTSLPSGAFIHPPVWPQ